MTGRISNFTYGTGYAIPYDPSDPEHISREPKSYLDSFGESASPAVSEARYCGFAIHCFLLILPDNVNALQGTNVSEDREIRFPFWYVTEGAPRRWALSSVFKYTGARGDPEWMDIERGSVFSFNDLRRTSTIVEIRMYTSQATLQYYSDEEAQVVMKCATVRCKCTEIRERWWALHALSVIRAIKR